ncbi:MAG: drug/metabolite transporter (DMT)-like permease [Polaribacter sp.]|jgi:drug/metabolite transporter (DMT)-like permease
MFSKNIKWVYLGILALVWGSSFILMKKALLGLTPIQLGALRIIITAIFLLLIGFKSLKGIEKHQWKYIAYTAALGTFFPAFMFAFAVNYLDSSIVAILNSLTPFNTLIFGALVFGFAFRKKQIIGVLIGLVGTLILILNGANLNPDQNYWFAFLIFLASIGYAFNVNMIKKHLNDVSALGITAGNFVLMIVPAFIILISTGFFTEFEMTKTNMSSLGYITVLAVLGTGIAKVLFNKIVQMSSPIFASSVTYLIPLVAVFWGILDGEKLSLIQATAGVVILLGVYLVNKNK